MGIRRFATLSRNARALACVGTRLSSPKVRHYPRQRSRGSLLASWVSEYPPALTRVPRDATAIVLIFFSRNVSSRTRTWTVRVRGSPSSGEREAGRGRLGHRQRPRNHRGCPRKLFPSHGVPYPKLLVGGPYWRVFERRAARARITEHLFLPAAKVANREIRWIIYWMRRQFSEPPAFRAPRTTSPARHVDCKPRATRPQPSVSALKPITPRLR